MQQAFWREFVEKVGTRAKKKKEMTGEEEVREGKACRKPHDFLRTSQIWSDLICGRRLQMLWSDIYLNHVCAKVYQI